LDCPGAFRPPHIESQETSFPFFALERLSFAATSLPLCLYRPPCCSPAVLFNAVFSGHRPVAHILFTLFLPLVSATSQASLPLLSMPRPALNPTERLFPAHPFSFQANFSSVKLPFFRPAIFVLLAPNLPYRYCLLPFSLASVVR